MRTGYGTRTSGRGRRAIRCLAIGSCPVLLVALGLASGEIWPLDAPAVGQEASAGLAQVPADGVMGFLVEDFVLPVIQGEDACPDGTVPRLRNAFMETLPDAERARLLREDSKQELERRWRSFAFGPNDTNICTHPQMFERSLMRSVQSPYALGLDLDGDNGRGDSSDVGCAQQDFKSPAGETGIDNQEYRALGCTLEWRGKDGVAGDVETGMRQHLASGEWTQVILLKGVDSLEHDEDVTVIYGNTPDRPIVDSEGRFLRGATFTISDKPPRYRNVLKGRIVDGMLTTEPARITLTQTWGQGGARDIRGNRTIYDFHEGRLRLTFQPDGTLQGFLGGYKPVFDTIQSPALGGAGSALVAGIDCAAYLTAVRHYADGLRNPATGRCEGISSAQRIKAIPAFVNDTAPRKWTAAR